MGGALEVRRVDAPFANAQKWMHSARARACAAKA